LMVGRETRCRLAALFLFMTFVLLAFLAVLPASQGGDARATFAFSLVPFALWAWQDAKAADVARLLDAAAKKRREALDEVKARIVKL
ncbi:MAG: hypothetical protein M3Y55_16090, partial [Pseudomonadota bacterium]|nr:hypothetical protein [Pseudomonadota bacterium]